MKKEFIASFQINKTIIFNVNYYTLSSNKNAYFTTSAEEFNRPKTDYNRCGQAQKDLLHIGSKARHFFNKWDNKHLSDLTEAEYKEMRKDLDGLMETYNYIFRELDEGKRPYNPYIAFCDVKALSMEKLPNSRQKAHLLCV